MVATSATTVRRCGLQTRRSIVLSRQRTLQVRRLPAALTRRVFAPQRLDAVAEVTTDA